MTRLHVAALSVTLILLSGCTKGSFDPAGPIADGAIALGQGLVADGFTRLEIRMFPSDVPFEDFVIPGDFDFDPDFISKSEPLDQVSFPTSYTIGGPLGCSEQGEWRVVAWLSNSETNSEEVPPPIPQPEPGDIVGTATFQAGEPSEFGFCDRILDVNLTLDTVVP